MTRQEIVDKIAELNKQLKEMDEPVGYKDDNIFLLSVEEYEMYKNEIPFIDVWWLLRSNGYNRSYIAYVSDDTCANTGGGFICNTSYAVRPALRYDQFEFTYSSIKKNRIIINDFPFIIIDEENSIAITEVPIAFDKFDDKSNDYENSYIRKWLLGWGRGGKNDN